jgi:hypothetical protein
MRSGLFIAFTYINSDIYAITSNSKYCITLSCMEGPYDVFAVAAEASRQMQCLGASLNRRPRTLQLSESDAGQ